MLWQLRHSIVHTGGTLTLPDAQKIPVLSQLGNKKVVFEKNFIFEVARKLHPLVKEATEGIGIAFKSEVISGIDAAAQRDIDEFFKIKSSIGAWLR